MVIQLVDSYLSFDKAWKAIDDKHRRHWYVIGLTKYNTFLFCI